MAVPTKKAPPRKVSYRGPKYYVGYTFGTFGTDAVGTVTSASDRSVAFSYSHAPEVTYFAAPRELSAFSFPLKALSV